MTYDQWRDEFAKGLDPRFYPIAFLDALAASGKVYFWFGESSAICGTVRTYPGGARVMDMLVGAGDLDEILTDLRPRLEADAVTLGCSDVMVSSREGWARALKDHGYEPWQVSVRKGL